VPEERGLVLADVVIDRAFAERFGGALVVTEGTPADLGEILGEPSARHG